ncbi:methyltransferase, TIGR04325 family [Acidimangrovimonas sediminis]|uniref:methyltransferase, TIGR04325 family n=1 Tax=Acidimangrovimonas sediminis TaxID=2056283 RepID=UPI000C7FE26F|nr:methyltransferase, TIGR04325 family [Acidimangrovimonas sediminis]
MVLSTLAHTRRHVRVALSTAEGRLRLAAGRPPRLSGAYPDYTTALAAVPPGAMGGYDHAEIADVAFEAMCALTLWDYPVMLWLREMWHDGIGIVDAGGHMGTKYIAFGPHLAIDRARWTVLDLPAICAAGRARQARGALPTAIGFATAPQEVPACDILLGSGLMQYMDAPLASLIGALPARPRRIILNKVATREGPTVVTLERIGGARVPYQIRNRAGFEAELAALPGYRLRDQWEIAGLQRVIGTHPALGPSDSRGYVLDLAE